MRFYLSGWLYEEYGISQNILISTVRLRKYVLIIPKDIVSQPGSMNVENKPKFSSVNI